MGTSQFEAAASGGRKAPKPPSSQGYNVLRLRAIDRLVRWSGFPYIFQALLLIVFVAMAVFAWNVYPSEGVPDKLFAKCHAVNL